MVLWLMRIIENRCGVSRIKTDNQLEIQQEIDRVRLAIHKTQSFKLRRDYTKYLHKLYKQQKSMGDMYADSSEVRVKGG